MSDGDIQISPESWQTICDHEEWYVDFMIAMEDRAWTPEETMAWLDERGLTYRVLPPGEADRIAAEDRRQDRHGAPTPVRHASRRDRRAAARRRR